MAVTEISIVHHVAIVFFLLWLLNTFNYGWPLFYILALVYLYQVNERYVMRLRRKLQFEQKRNANQRRVLLESETVRWLNHAIEKIWPVCMEEIVSQKIFLPIIPWFLDKYKPWTIKKAAIEQLYLGRKPPMFTEMRVLRESSDDDHLVLELGLNFLTADDMNAILAAKLLNSLGFGIVTKMHITSMHVEGKVLVGVKFIRDWPYVSRLRICFAEPPYFQMTVKPIFNHGIDVTEVPGIAGWLDNLLAVAFEETLVEPNMLVVDMEKFVLPQPSSETTNWFSVLAKEPVAIARVEVIEGSEMKPSDLNGLADPYVKGQLGQYRFKTQIQWKTLAPKWQEEFKLPICSWESVNVLTFEVRDKDHFTDDNLGVCSVDINQFKDGARHDMWVPLVNIKMGRLHLAITVVQADSKEVSKPAKDENLSREVRGHEEDPPESKMAVKASGSSELSKNSHKFSETFEEIDIDGQEETGMWIHHPGSDILQTWEPRKERSRRQSDTEIQREGECSCDENVQGNKTSHRPNIFSMGLHMINNVFRKNQKREDEPVSSDEPVLSPRVNVKAVDACRIGIKLQVEPEDSLAEHQNVKTTAADLEGGRDDKESSENTKAQAKSDPDNSGKSYHQIKHALSSMGSKNLSRNSIGEANDRGVNFVDSESSDEDSVSNEPFLEGVPIPSSEATNDGDSNTANCTEEIVVVTRDPLEATAEADGEVASKNA